MDPASIVEDTAILSTDGQTDRRKKVIPVYTPFNFVGAGV